MHLSGEPGLVCVVAEGPAGCWPGQYSLQQPEGREDPGAGQEAAVATV